MSETNDVRSIQPAAPPPSPGDSLAELAIPGTPQVAYSTNLPTATRAQRALITRCLAEPSLEQGDVLNVPFLLAGVLAHRVSFVNEETGEVSEGIRCVLCRNDGATVAFVSQGVYKGLCLLMLLEGRGPWPEPLPILIRQVSVGQKKRTYTVELLDTKPADNEAKGTKRGR